jgi:hypothetical protein
MSDRCENILKDGGSEYRCVGVAGHGGPHEHGGLEWREYGMTRIVTYAAPNRPEGPSTPREYPEIPSHLKNPIVFRDKNLGIAMIAGAAGKQWIYRAHNGHWCSVREVNDGDPMFILEALNKPESVAPPSTPDQELAFELAKRFEIAAEKAGVCPSAGLMAHFILGAFVKIRAEYASPPSTPTLDRLRNAAREIGYRSSVEGCAWTAERILNLLNEAIATVSSEARQGALEEATRVRVYSYKGTFIDSERESTPLSQGFKDAILALAASPAKAVAPKAAIKFWLVDRGDPSVGMDGWCEEITITRSKASEFTPDEIELLQAHLVECLGPDCSCLTEAEMEAEADVPDLPGCICSEMYRIGPKDCPVHRQLSLHAPAKEQPSHDCVAELNRMYETSARGFAWKIEDGGTRACSCGKLYRYVCDAGRPCRWVEVQP